MIERGDAGRGEAGEEAVKGQVVVEPAPVVGALLVGRAARPAAVEIAQRDRIPHRLRRAMAGSASGLPVSPRSRQKRRAPIASARSA